MTLSQLTRKARFILKLAGLALIILIAIRLGGYIKERIAPTPPPPPTVSFGKLPNIAFPKTTTNIVSAYSIDTITGTLPTFPDRARVYKIVSNAPNFLALDRAQNKLSKIGFTLPPIPLSQNLYLWSDKTPLARRIIFNIYSLDFILSSLFFSDPAVKSVKNLPDEKTAVNMAKTFFSQISFPEDIDTTKTKTSFFSIIDGSLTPTTSISSAQIIRVDFFQKDVNSLPIYYQSPLNSSIYILITGAPLSGASASEPQVVEASFSHKTISQEFATYPIKTVNQAYFELKNEKAYIASYFGNDKNVSIRKVFLAYYLGKGTQKFLMPLFIFEGDRGFFAYVSAVKDEWINN